MPAYKETYYGQGIYWHHAARMYGDETNPLYRTIGEYRAAIDAHIAQERNNRPEHEKYWDTLSHDERQHWRRACAATSQSASECAYAARKE